MIKSFFIKVKGFTIMEVLVGVMLGSIVFSSSLFVWNNINKQFFRFSNATSGLQEITVLKTALQQEFLEARTITQQNANTIIINRIHKAPVYYYFKDKEVIRESTLLSDTFKLKMVNFSVTTLAENNLTNEDVVSYLSFNAEVDGLVYPLSFEKKYGAVYKIGTN